MAEGRRIEPDDKYYTKKLKVLITGVARRIGASYLVFAVRVCLCRFGPYATGLNCFKGVVDLRWGGSGSPE